MMCFSGIIGDWKKHFTVTQNEQMDDVIKRKIPEKSIFQFPTHNRFIYRRDTCFDAHLFRRLFCLYHVILCARSDDVTACFFVDSDILNKKDVL